jgi:hypothetical protein
MCLGFDRSICELDLTYLLLFFFFFGTLLFIVGI